ncbi:MAG: Fic family protein [Elusimicrobiota bacterium]
MPNIFDEIDRLQEEINKHRPLDKGLLKQVKEYYRIGLTYSSNALEGNSLTETETKIVLEEGITIGGKPLKDHLEAIGHSQAYDYLCDLASKKTFEEQDIKKLHQFFYYRIDSENAGNYREVRVYITGSKYPLPLPEAVPKLMKDLLAKLEKIRKKRHPVEFSALAHQELVFVHPFIDGNGRICRLLMNLILLQEGYTPAVIFPVNRPEYIRTLEKAHQDSGDFINFIARTVKETQKDYLRLFT